MAGFFLKKKCPTKEKQRKNKNDAREVQSCRLGIDADQLEEGEWLPLGNGVGEAKIGGGGIII